MHNYNVSPVSAGELLVFVCACQVMSAALPRPVKGDAATMDVEPVVLSEMQGAVGEGNAAGEQGMWLGSRGCGWGGYSGREEGHDAQVDECERALGVVNSR